MRTMGIPASRMLCIFWQLNVLHDDTWMLSTFEATFQQLTIPTPERLDDLYARYRRTVRALKNFMGKLFVQGIIR